jgi:hypothetical protein
MAKSVFDEVDDWLDRVQLVDEGDDEVARFLDTLDRPLRRRARRPLRRRLLPPARLDRDAERVLAPRDPVAGRHAGAARAPSRAGRGGGAEASASPSGGRRRSSPSSGRWSCSWSRRSFSAARRWRAGRIRLATRAPLQELWDALGSAGDPPRDQSRKFAVVAIVVTTLTWFVVPAALAIVFLT